MGARAPIPNDHLKGLYAVPSKMLLRQQHTRPKTAPRTSPQKGGFSAKSGPNTPKSMRNQAESVTIRAHRPTPPDTVLRADSSGMPRAPLHVQQVVAGEFRLVGD